jgi:hypothetical protein
MIDQMYLMLYNLLWTSLPPLAIGTPIYFLKDFILYVLAECYVTCVIRNFL